MQTQFKLQVGQAVRERAPTGLGCQPRELTVVQRGYFEGQPAYVLNDSETGEVQGWYSEDMIEPYDSTPIPHSWERP